MHLDFWGLEAHKRRRHILLGVLMATTSLAVAPEARAQSIEHLDGHEGVALSNDGRYYVFNGAQGYYHTPDGTHQIPRYSNFISAARAISGDGQVVVGTGRGDQSQPSAFRWSQADGLTELGMLGTDPRHKSEANGVSGDGSRIVGNSDTDAGLTQGFVWVQGATGGVGHNQQMYQLEAGEANSLTLARAISDNGNVAVGGYHPNGSVIERAMRWDLTNIDEGGGLVGTALGDLTGGNGFSKANGVSGDGSVVVGAAVTGSGYSHAFLWREGGTGGVAGNEQMIDLGTLGGMSSMANGVSSGGDYVVGSSQDPGGAIAFRWDEERGMVAVEELLSEDDVDVGDWRLQVANDVSTDGRVIIGTMNRAAENRAFLARLGDGTGGGGGGVMDVEEYNRTLYAGAGGIASAGEFLSWLPMNGAHHRPLMMTPDLTGDMCAWASGDFAHHGGSSTGLALAEIGACTDLAGGSVRIGGAVGTTRSWQDLSLGGSSRLAGQYVLGEVDWQPDGTPLLLSATGMLGGWQANVGRAYSNGAATAVSSGQTRATGGVIRLRADWLEAVSLGNTTFNPWTSVSLGALHVDGYTESSGPFPALFNAQSMTHVDVRVGLTAVTEFSSQTKLSTTFEVAHRSGTAPGASGQVDGLFAFSLGGGRQSQTWVRAGVELDHKITDNLSLSTSVHLATAGRDPSIAGSLGVKAVF